MNVSIGKGTRPSNKSLVTKFTKNTGSKVLIKAYLLPALTKEKDISSSLKLIDLVIETYQKIEMQMVSAKGSEAKKEFMVMAQFAFSNIIGCACSGGTTELIVSDLMNMLEVTGNLADN